MSDPTTQDPAAASPGDTSPAPAPDAAATPAAAQPDAPTAAAATADPPAPPYDRTQSVEDRLFDLEEMLFEKLMPRLNAIVGEL